LLCSCRSDRTGSLASDLHGVGCVKASQMLCSMINDRQCRPAPALAAALSAAALTGAGETLSMAPAVTLAAVGRHGACCSGGSSGSCRYESIRFRAITAVGACHIIWGMQPLGYSQLGALVEKTRLWTCPVFPMDPRLLHVWCNMYTGNATCNS
jgi:hypothetical protein